MSKINECKNGVVMEKYIVLVDDEELILKSLVREFSPFCEKMDIIMKIFTSVSDAMGFLTHENKQTFLVISDLRMPEQKGSIFLQQINKLYPDIKLFLLTAYSDIADIQEAVKASINRLIIKPWDYEDLQASIKNAYDSYTLENENKILKKELLQNLEVAGDFQKRLLKEPDFTDSSLTINIKYIPVPNLKCGGDYYDYVNISKNKDLIMIGDVSGHGIKPAFVTSMLKVLCCLLKHDFYNTDIDLGNILTQINEGLFKSLGDIKDIITTYTAILIDSEKKTLKLSGAGQLPVYILRKNKLICLKMESPAMGFIHDFKYKEMIENLETDDLIIMFTDGLIESEKSKTIIDEKRIQSLLVSLDLETNPSETILKYFRELQPDKTFADDITIITTRIL